MAQMEVRADELIGDDLGAWESTRPYVHLVATRSMGGLVQPLTAP